MMKFAIHLEIEQPKSIETITIKTSDLVDLITENQTLKEKNFELKKQLFKAIRSKSKDRTHLQELISERQLQKVFDEAMSKIGR